MFQYKASCISIYDGDTITLEVDMGFRCKLTAKFRLYGINAPELTKATREKGIAARDRLADLVMGMELTIESFKDPDDFGRWLCIVHVAGLSKSVNDILVEEGHAVRFRPK